MLFKEYFRVPLQDSFHHLSIIKSKNIQPPSGIKQTFLVELQIIRTDAITQVFFMFSLTATFLFLKNYNIYFPFWNACFIVQPCIILSTFFEYRNNLQTNNRGYHVQELFDWIWKREVVFSGVIERRMLWKVFSETFFWI